MKARLFVSTLFSLALAGALTHDVARADGDQSPKVIATYDFESTANLAAWREEKKTGETPAIMALDAENPHGGKFSFKFGTDKDAAVARTAYARVGLPEGSGGTKVTVEFYGRTTPELSGKAAFRALEFSQGKPVGWVNNLPDLVAIDKGKDWTLYKAEAVLRDKTDTLFLYPFLSLPKAGEALWIDDLTVKLSR